MLNNENKNRAVIYDFDNTLFHSHSRETGAPLYLEKTGLSWPYTGWWGRPETLLPPFVSDPITEEYFVTDTLKAYQKDRQRNDTTCYFMTGRPIKMKKRILEILQAVGADFDKYYFRGGPKQAHLTDTLEIKLDIITNEIINDDLQILEIWEDRNEHVLAFNNEIHFWKTMFPNLTTIVVHEVTSCDNVKT